MYILENIAVRVDLLKIDHPHHTIPNQRPKISIVVKLKFLDFSTNADEYGIPHIIS